MDKVYDFITKEIGLTYGDSIVVGVSGGPDSMALLHLLTRVKKAYDIEVICAHVNHNVRVESSEEKKFVEKYCVNNNVVFESTVILDYGDDNFHNEARSKRYSHFLGLIKKYNAKYLFTAHHGDDLIETILMRLARGSTLKGYSGFSKILDLENCKLIRPLINLTKAEIIEYNKQNKIKYVQDPSNDKDVYTRNRFRKYIVPQFKKEDKNVHKKFYKFSETLLEYNNYIDNQVKNIIKKVYVQNILNVEKFLQQEVLIQNKIIYLILEKTYLDDLMLISDVHVDLITSLIKSKKANNQIYLPNNYKVIKSYNEVVITKEEENTVSYEIDILEHVNLPNGKNIEKILKTKEDSNYICRLDSKEISMPLRVRTRKDGDKMSIKGMLGRKKINDIFIDNKIPLKERDWWPVVVDSSDNIVWLPGLKKSKFDKPKEELCDIILKYY